MTKTYNFFKKIIISFFIVSHIVCSFVFAEEKKWTLAAEKFSYPQQKNLSKSNESLTKTVPSLILEQMAQNLTRLPRSREILDRTLFDLKKDRLSLFLQLSSEVKKRDSLVLESYSERKLKAKIKESDKKIAEIQKKIDDNLQKVNEEREKHTEKIHRDDERLKHIEEGGIVKEDQEKNAFIRFFSDFTNSSSDSAVLEQVVLYQDDFLKLFEPSQTIAEQGYTSYAFQKACADANIQGLLTGTITQYGEYVSINANLYVYPGGKLIASATDVGLFGEMRTLATNIAFQLTPRIADSMPVELLFEVFPKEAEEHIFITVDDVVYQKIQTVRLPSGVHTISFSAEGFSSEQTSYSFTGNRQFKISVTMDHANNGEINVAFKKPFEGDMFANGLFSASVSAENRFAQIKVNDRQILGHFISTDGAPADFIIPAKLLQDDTFLMVNTKPYDRSAYIEKRRKWMYRSYSLLMVSLIPTFYCYGTYNSMAAAYNSEYGVSYEDAIKWQKAKNITMGISIGCGVLFAEELVRYLISANSVIPKQAKKIKPARMAKIRAAEERALQKRLEEEERLLEEEKLLQEENEAQNEEENNVQTEQTDSEHKVSDSTK